jgi:DNA-directed RNA polymerase specialized sigma24 family protein
MMSILNNDEPSWVDDWLKHRPFFFRLAGPQYADDAMQDCALRALKMSRSGKPVRSGLLRRIACGQRVDRWRSPAEGHAFIALDDSAEQCEGETGSNSFGSVTTQSIELALDLAALLSPIEFRIAELRLKDFTDREVSDCLGISEDSVYRIRCKIQKRLENYCEH